MPTSANCLTGWHQWASIRSVRSLAELRPVFGQRNWHHVLQFFPYKNSTIFHLSEPATAPFQHNQHEKVRAKMVLQDGRPVPNGTGHPPVSSTPEVVCMRMESPSVAWENFPSTGRVPFSRPRDMTWISCRNEQTHNARAENGRGGN